jgi:uncharacterized protein with HEPN domain
LPSDRQVRHLSDIADAILRIRRLTQDMQIEAFEEDERTNLAVERLLQILTEAAHRLGREASAICPEVNWRDVRDFGNFLRHEYDQVLGRNIWDTIHHDLPPLLLAVQSVLNRLDQATKDATSKGHTS